MSLGNQQPGRGRPGGPTPLTHSEAEALISARLDGPLDPESNRNLLAHLVGCASCRSFAERMESMVHGLRDLPHLPPSPTVSRQVRERVEAGQSVWDRMIGGLTRGRFGMAPAAAAAMALLAVLGFLVVSQLNNDETPEDVDATRTTISAASLTETATVEPTPTTPLGTNTPVPPTATDIINVVIDETPTPTSTLERSATSTPNVIETPTPTLTEEPTDTPAPPDTATPEPTDTAEPTVTPEPTETAQPTDTATSEPTDTAVPEPSDTATAEPTETPEPSITSEPTETETPRPTDTPEPTETETPQPTETAEPTDTATEEPSATAEPSETPTETATATATETATEAPPATPVATDTPEPTVTPEPTATATATPEPTQPPIVPRGGETQPSDATETSQEEPTEEPPAVPTEGGIEPSDTTAVPEEQTPEPPAETATQETLVAEVTLADAETVASLPAGIQSPTGPMVFNPNGSSAIVYQDGVLAYMDMSGNISPIDSGSMPMWSPLGQVLLYQNATDLQSSAIAAWDPLDGSIYQVTGSEQPKGGSVNDVPAGWIGDQLYYLRIFNDRPGYVELHRTEWNGDNDTLVWSQDGVTLTADHPISTGEVILIPTDSSWLSVTPDGNMVDLGANTTGPIGDALVSPFGSVILYVSGGVLNLALTSAPGSVIDTVTFPDGGFDFSPDGSEFVTAGTDGLVTFNSDTGEQLNFIANGEGMHATAPAWTDSGILFIDSGAEPAMRRYVID